MRAIVSIYALDDEWCGSIEGVGLLFCDFLVQHDQLLRRNSHYKVELFDCVDCRSWEDVRYFELLCIRERGLGLVDYYEGVGHFKHHYIGVNIEHESILICERRPQLLQ